MEAVTKHVFPQCALPKQKCQMHHRLCKPLDMTIGQFMTAIQDMNQDFKYFPDAGDDPSLAEDELADIVEVGCPNTWQHHELIQGFDAMEHSLTKLMEFFECLETAEQLCDGNSHQTKSLTKIGLKPTNKNVVKTKGCKCLLSSRRNARTTRNPTNTRGKPGGAP